jgi:hypothetical protein
VYPLTVWEEENAMAVKNCVRPAAAGIGIFIMGMAFSIVGVPQAHASCGSAVCFMLTGEEGAVHGKGKLSVGLQYAYTISKVASGTSGLVTSVDQEARQLVMNEHQENRTIAEITTLDINYGLTNNFTLEVLVPHKRLTHTHTVELGSADANPTGLGVYEKFNNSGLGDIRLNGKYHFLPTLRSLVVLGFGVDLPTGDSHANGNVNQGNLQEPTLQLGRRSFGVVPSVYQSYEIIPHVLDQFASVSYQHAFTGPNSYRFGDVYVLSGGLNWKTLGRVTLTGQFNWRYAVHDEFTGSLARAQTPADPTFPDEPIVIDPEMKRRPVPTTGSTMLAASPGISVAVRENMRAYFFAQIPIVRDFNGGLIPDVGFLFGLSMSMN